MEELGNRQRHLLLRLAKLVILQSGRHRTIRSEQIPDRLGISQRLPGPGYRLGGWWGRTQAHLAIRAGSLRLLEKVPQWMRPAQGHFEHSIEQLGREGAGEVPQVAKELLGRLRIFEGAMRPRMHQAELPG